MRLAPAGWGLVVVTSGVSLLSVIIFLETGTFSNGWLVTTAIVYALVIVAAVVLAAMDRAPVALVASSVKDGEAKLITREVVYRARAGDAIRLTYKWADGTIERRHVAMTTGTMLTDRDIITHVDALAPADEPKDLVQSVEAALARHASQAQTKEQTA